MIRQEYAKYLNPDLKDIIEGRNKEGLEGIKRKFRKKRIISIEDFLSGEGLAFLRKELEKLKSKEKKTIAGHKQITGIDTEVLEEVDFIRFLAEWNDFRNFLRIISGFNNLEIRKKKRMNVNISYQAGDKYDWHFDGNGITVIVPIESPNPKNGGQFAYYPLFRKLNSGIIDRTLTKIMYMFRLERILLKEEMIHYVPGSLVVFDGDTTYHCAVPLKGKDHRRILIYHYVK